MLTPEEEATRQALNEKAALAARASAEQAAAAEAEFRTPFDAVLTAIAADLADPATLQTPRRWNAAHGVQVTVTNYLRTRPAPTPPPIGPAI